MTQKWYSPSIIQVWKDSVDDFCFTIPQEPAKTESNETETKPIPKGLGRVIVKLFKLHSIA